MKLYFIALIPPEPVAEEVRQMKLEMKSRFSAGHALKAPAHITLQMPFRFSEDEESKLTDALSNAAGKMKESQIELSGFSCFPPRVIFVRVMSETAVKSCHEALKPYLLRDIGLSTKQVSDSITPHMTIATRDLTREEFEKAWPEFKERKYEAVFNASAVYLLKHNGKFWDVYREFPFGGSLRERL